MAHSIRPSHHRLRRLRRNAWRAVALCALLRLTDTAFGLGLIEPAAQAPTHLPVPAAPARPAIQENTP